MTIAASPPVTAVVVPALARPKVAGTSAGVTRTAARGTPVLADDACTESVFDGSTSTGERIALVLARLRDAQDRPDSERLRALLADVADAGLLDADIDLRLALVRGYASPEATSVSGADLAEQVIAQVGSIWPVGATALQVQRIAILALAGGRETAANDRLLRALRRGSVIAAAPVAGALPVLGRGESCGGVRIDRALLRVESALAASAVMVAVALTDGQVVTGWLGRRAAGVELTPVGVRGGVLALREVRIGPDELLSEAVTGPSTLLLP